MNCLFIWFDLILFFELIWLALFKLFCNVLWWILLFLVKKPKRGLPLVLRLSGLLALPGWGRVLRGLLSPPVFRARTVGEGGADSGEGLPTVCETGPVVAPWKRHILPVQATQHTMGLRAHDRINSLPATTKLQNDTRPISDQDDGKFRKTCTKIDDCSRRSRGNFR